MSDDVTWITVNGAHVPVKDGQDKGEAIREHFSSKREPGVDRAVRPSDDIASQTESRMREDVESKKARAEKSSTARTIGKYNDQRVSSTIKNAKEYLANKQEADQAERSLQSYISDKKKIEGWRDAISRPKRDGSAWSKEEIDFANSEIRAMQTRINRHEAKYGH